MRLFAHAHQFLRLTSPHERKRFGRWFVWCILASAAINVAFAATRLQTLRHNTKLPHILRSDDDMPQRWPAATPHDTPWPAPTDWDEFRALGNRRYTVSHVDDERRRSLFNMRAQLTGWPLPVLVQQSLGWDASNPAFPGRSGDVPLRLMPLGLILNPIIIGGGGYLLLIAAPLAFVLGRRLERRRQGLCVYCAFDINDIENNICPKCDTPRRADAAHSA